MDDRQEEMNAALLSGNPSKAARMSGLIIEATPVAFPPSMVTNLVRRVCQDAQ